MSFANPAFSLAPVAGQTQMVDVVSGATLATSGGTITNVATAEGRAWRTGGATNVDVAWAGGRAVSASNTTPDFVTILFFGSQSAAPSTGTGLRLMQLGEAASPQSTGIGIHRSTDTSAQCDWIGTQSTAVSGVDWTQRRAYVAQMAINEGGASNDICRLWAGGLAGAPDGDTGVTLRSGTGVLNNIRLGLLNNGSFDYERVRIYLGAGGPTLAECRAAANCTTLAEFDALMAGPVATAPAIGVQPVGATVTAGATHTTSVTASGTAPLAYQWRKNGANISGANSASYTTPALVVGDSGAAFTVVVSNGAAPDATSNGAIVTVNAAASTYSATLPAVLTDGTGATTRLNQTTRMIAEPFTSIEALGAGARHIVTATTHATTGVVTVSNFPSAGVWAVLGVFPATGATIDGVRFRLVTAA